jgi:hypothetical protein
MSDWRERLAEVRARHQLAEGRALRDATNDFLIEALAIHKGDSMSDKTETTPDEIPETINPEDETGEWELADESEPSDDAGPELLTPEQEPTRVDVVPLGWGVRVDGELEVADLTKTEASRHAKKLAKARRPAEVTFYAANGLDWLRKEQIR